ncbi:hypothetical protein CFC21_015551 [Triticum aestivum]|uniref:Uncharacterized protein n=2 Tax=Triticum aestivum TaxID=4565 RepID=A0A3B6ASU9_WHEAT|nr:uncharacterized protein LOC123184793 [Triticum aestivum]KAF6999541.1 hypothetical protein CFC21_015551 [Triticum aestivum]
MALAVVVVLPSLPPPPPPPPEQIVVAVLPSPPPPPPPARVVVVVPARVRLPGVLRVAALALIYLGFAVAWVMAAATAAEVVARRAWGEGSAPVLFLQAVMYGAVKVCVCIILAFFALVVLLLCAQCVTYVIAPVSGSTSGFKKSTFGAIRPEFTAHFFRLLRPAVLGFVVDLAFVLLAVAGLLVEMMSPHVKGSISQGEMVGSVIEDVGIFGMHATVCFLIIPALVLSVWREC